MNEEEIDEEMKELMHGWVDVEMKGRMNEDGEMEELMHGWENGEMEGASMGLKLGG